MREDTGDSERECKRAEVWKYLRQTRSSMGRNETRNEFYEGPQPLCVKSVGADAYVSLPVHPNSGHDEAGSVGPKPFTQAVARALRLFARLANIG